ncbi:MAG TPA: hypothetical protein [Caudoviricetes sp.]|nr:MAG TPA: hypothetical protein [Caudoviricetes sp.]
MKISKWLIRLWLIVATQIVKLVLWLLKLVEKFMDNFSSKLMKNI